MNLFRLSLLLIAILLITSCGDDDSAPSCNQSEWIGTYTGTQDCTGGASGAVTVTITASGASAIVIKYETAFSETEFEAVILNGCTINVNQTAGSDAITLNATLNADELTLDDTFTSGGSSLSCMIVANRL